MSKNLYTLTIERDHFNKKVKDLEHRQKTMEAELTASQFAHMNLGSPTPLSPIYNDKPSVPTPMNPVINGGMSGGTGGHHPVSIHSNDHTPVKPPITSPLPPEKPLYNLQNPPPDIDLEDIRMILSMGFNFDKPEELFKVVRDNNGDISRVIEELLKKINNNNNK